MRINKRCPRFAFWQRASRRALLFSQLTMPDSMNRSPCRQSQGPGKMFFRRDMNRHRALKTAANSPISLDNQIHIFTVRLWIFSKFIFETRPRKLALVETRPRRLPYLQAPSPVREECSRLAWLNVFNNSVKNGLSGGISLLHTTCTISCRSSKSKQLQ